MPENLYYVAFYNGASDEFCAAMHDGSLDCANTVPKWLDDGRCVKKVRANVAKAGMLRYSHTSELNNGVHTNSNDS
ncbi:MAG: hypothetical protein WC942_12095 [Clostridia bacterium]